MNSRKFSKNFFLIVGILEIVIMNLGLGSMVFCLLFFPKSFPDGQTGDRFPLIFLFTFMLLVLDSIFYSYIFNDYDFPERLIYRLFDWLPKRKREPYFPPSSGASEQHSISTTETFCIFSYGPKMPDYVKEMYERENGDAPMSESGDDC